MYLSIIYSVWNKIIVSDYRIQQIDDFWDVEIPRTFVQLKNKNKIGIKIYSNNNNNKSKK